MSFRFERSVHCITDIGDATHQFTVTAEWTEGDEDDFEEGIDMPETTKLTRGQALALAKQVAAALQEAEKLIAKYGEDKPDGTVIRFRKRFPSNRTMPADQWIAIHGPNSQPYVPASVEYDYAAIRANGLWYTTGPKSPKGFEWEELLDWLDEGIPVDSIEVWPLATAEIVQDTEARIKSIYDAIDLVFEDLSLRGEKLEKARKSASKRLSDAFPGAEHD